MASEGQHLAQKPCFSKSQSPLHAIPGMSESSQVFSWRSKSTDEDSQTAAKILDRSIPSASALIPVTVSNYERLNSIKSKNVMHDKDCMQASDSRPCMLASSNFASQHVAPLDKAPKLRSSFQPAGPNNDCHLGKTASISTQGQGPIFPGRSSSNLHFRSNGQSTKKTDDNSNMSEKRNLQRNHEVSSELLRGPRSNNLYGSVNYFYNKKSNLNDTISRDQFNKPDLQIIHKEAKFFMIKSFSEDDIHKSIKYNVWASTPYGNKKLDAAYWDAERQSKENGRKCPIFLFFSVNASGQFVGMAEMIGPVDFEKTMDFWEQDKWSGFFPVTWHIIKDIPNRHFQSITLENNDNRAVTFSRDTQEIPLPQGLRMLHIFKGYPNRMSILDDFDFYEKRAKSLRSGRNTWPVPMRSEAVHDDSLHLEHLGAAVRKMDLSERPKRTTSHPKSSTTVPLPKNLLINNIAPDKRT